MRDIVVHYHLFKNAGSSIDALLSERFGERWGQLEGEMPWSILGPDDLLRFVEANPQYDAISSHQLRLPLPQDDRYRFHPVFLVRDPIDRAGSVYAFERGQPAGASPGADAARTMDFAGYVEWRLRQPDGGTICNFQCIHIGWQPGDEDFATSLGRSIEAFDRHPGAGVVERFAQTMQRLAAAMPAAFRPDDARREAVNRGAGRQGSLQERIEAIRIELGEELYARLLERNALDAALHRHALARFDALAG